MYINTNRENYDYDITTEKKKNKVSYVVCIKSFICPTTNDQKRNKTLIEQLEQIVYNIIKYNVESSNVLSTNYILDFDCTKNNLNTDKWSRLTINVYLMANCENCEDDVLKELSEICDYVGKHIVTFGTNNGLKTTANPQP